MMGKPYSNILVPYDDSKYSQKALKMAFEMAEVFNSSLNLVNVIDITTVSPPGKIHSKNTKKIIDQIKNSVKTSVESYLQKIQKNHISSGIIINGFILEGEITEKLLKFIQDHNIYLVII